jgi:hypothetical protein
MPVVENDSDVRVGNREESSPLSRYIMVH